MSPSFGIGDLEVFTYEVQATDPEGDALTYLWDFGLGATATTRVWGQPHFGGQSGARTVTIRVTDSRGESVSGR